MGLTSKKPIKYLVVDTTAFIQNAPLHEMAEHILTCPEVISEITNKRQLRRLVVLPYDLTVKEAFPENVRVITEFAKKTGDYPSLSATDIKVMALSYQLEKEQNGTSHLNSEPVVQKPIVTLKNKIPDKNLDVTGFFFPGSSKNHTKVKEITEDHKDLEEDFLNEPVTTDIDETSTLTEKIESLNCSDEPLQNDSAEDVEILCPVQESSSDDEYEDEEENSDSGNSDSGWINPSNIEIAKKQVNSELLEEKHVDVACITTDFAMQNVLRQMKLNVCALDGRIIKQLRTYILRCYTCFKTTSVMTKKFCPKCGNSTLKRVAVSVNENGKMQIHINPKRPLTARGKKFSLPKIKGGKHPNNPILVEDQPMPDNRPTRLARTKNNPLDDDYIAGFSPFVMRDVNSKSAQLCIRPNQEFKHWMRKNPNETRRKRK